MTTAYAINNYRDGNSIRASWQDGHSFSTRECAGAAFGFAVYTDMQFITGFEQAQLRLREMATAKMVDEECPDYSAADIAAEDFAHFSYDAHNWSIIEISIEDEDLYVEDDEEVAA